MPEKPRIALVHDWLTGFAGGEQVLSAFHELYPDAPMYTSLYRPEGVPQFKDATVIPSYLQRFPYLRGHHQIAIPLMPLAFESFDLKEFDLVLSDGCGLSKGVITQPGQPHVTYCHTPTRYLWRIGADTRADGILRSRVSHRMRIWDAVSADRVDTWLCNSDTVKRRIAKVYRKEAETVYPPVDVERFKPVEKAGGDYFITVSRLITYKRVDIVIKACIAARQPLKVVGGGPEEGALRKLAAGAPWIEFLGRVPDAKLLELYQGAKAFLFAAEEDFGIVPVEAMACGKPVIAYGKGGATESVREGVSGMLFAEQSAESLAAALTRFRDDGFDPAKVRAHAEGFGKDRFKKRIAEVVASSLS